MAGGAADTGGGQGGQGGQRFEPLLAKFAVLMLLPLPKV